MVSLLTESAPVFSYEYRVFMIREGLPSLPLVIEYKSQGELQNHVN